MRTAILLGLLLSCGLRLVALGPARALESTSVSGNNTEPVGAPAAYLPPSGYSYVRPITIDHRQVANTDQTDFPVLISTTLADLATVANGGKVQNSNGYDIIFTSDAAGTNQLDHEIDSYNATTGAVGFWVRIPTLSHTTDTPIYMWYGNSGVTASQENKAGVWRNGYAAVWHFGGSTLSTSDSTANANNATNHGVVGATGKFGEAGSFDGSGNTYFRIPSSSSFKPATAITLEAWVNMNGPTNWAEIFSLDYRADGTWNSPNVAYALDFYSNTLQPRFDVTVNGSGVATYGATPLSTGQWAHVVGTYDGANIVVYANGAQVAKTPQTGALSYGTSQDLNIGTRSPYTTGEPVNGLTDEARISTVARSSDWIATEYHNQNSPSSFFQVCAATAAGTQPPACTIPVAPSSFSFYRQILVDHRQVPNTDQTDCPVIISVTLPDLATTGNGGKVQNSNGYDIVFTSDAAGRNQLDHEIDSYNPSTGAAGFWVRIPTLSHTTDTAIYMWYGNSAVMLSQENKPGVWRNGYAGVWHFGGSSLSTNDSTANGNNAMNHGVTGAAGKFGQAASFDGSNNTYFDIPSSSSFKPATSLTLEGWTYLNNQTQSYPTIVSLDYNANGSWSSPYDAYWLGFYAGTTQPRLSLESTGTNGPMALPTGQWGHIVGTYDGSNLTMYVNGAKVSSTPQTGAIAYGPSKDLAIGNESPYALGAEINGLIDEVRVSTVARSSDWIATEYNNQNSPSTFSIVCGQAVGGGQLPPCSLLSPPSSFSFFRQIVIDHRQVPNTDQTDFPFLVTATLPDLATVANGGKVQNSSGYDIVFSSDAAGQNQLDHEIDSYNPTTGAAGFWVRIPTLSHTTDTTIYMWYGNSAVQVSQENKPGVWRNGYAAVWHFGNSSLSVADSTSNQNNAINYGVTGAAGKFGQAASFNGSTYFDIPASSSYKPTTSLTVEAWANLNSQGYYPRIVSLDYNATGSWSSPYQAYALGFFVSYQEPSFAFGNSLAATAPQALPLGQWGHIVGTYDGSNMVVYANGTKMSATPQTGNIAYGTSKDLAIGIESPYAPGAQLSGLIDEVRISTVTRSADWIQTEYNNQSSPSTSAQICPATAAGSQPPACVIQASISSFSFFRQIVIDHSKVANTDQTDFPFLLSASLPDLATVANGGVVQNSNGYDIVFTSDSAGQSRLDHEIDSYNPVTGAAAFWVRIPTLSHTTDTTIYMWYDSMAVQDSQENKPGVWRNGYAAVWHVGSGTTFAAADSTGVNSGAFSNITPTSAGKIGGGVSFSGATASYVDIPNNTTIKPSTALTLEAWVNPSQASGSNPIFNLDYRADGSWNSPWTSYALSAGASQIEFSVTGANGSIVRLDGTKRVPTSWWSHLAGTYDGSTLHLFENGVPDTVTASAVGPISYGTSKDLSIGTNGQYQSSNTSAWNGLMDELRISSVARSGDWIASEYNNQASPSTSSVICPATAAGNPPGPCSVSGLAIFGVNPGSAPVGTLITITGAGFGSAVASVSFNGSASIINSWSPVTITTTVPAGATTGPLVVTTSSQSTVQAPFTVVAPAALTTADINVSTASSVSLNNGVYTVTTHGTDVWGTSDSVTFLYQQWTGDFDVMVRVASQQNSAAWAKAGLMVRETLDPAARNVFAVLTPTQGARTQWRLAPGASEVDHPGVPSAQPAYWIRLIRRGNNFAGLGSPDGQQWFALGSQTVAMASTVYVGIGQTANNSPSNTSTYDSYSAKSSALPSPWLEQDLGLPSTPGVSVFDGTSFIIHATGQDLANTNDSAHFIYQPWTGDFDMRVHAAYLQNSTSGAKVGIMAREAGSDAANAAAWITPSGADGMSWRLSIGATSGQANVPLVTKAPAWLRLIRRSNNFSMYVSQDASNWQLQAAKTVAMGSSIYVGAFATTSTAAQTASVVDSLQVGVPSAPSGLQAPWSEADIGTVYSAAGNSTFDSLSTVVLSGGYDVWNAPDAFHFIYQSMSGDFDAAARLTYLENTDPWAKIGLVVRQSLDPSAAMFGTLDSSTNGAWPEWRYVSSGSPSSENGPASNATRPYWVRLVRRGNTWWSYGSTNATSWTLLAMQNVTMTSPVYLGIAASPHNGNGPGNSAFDGLSIRSTTLTAVPKVVSVNPAMAGPGTPLAIQGSGFGTSTGSVQIGGVSVTSSSWNDGNITVSTPQPAPTGPVVVTAIDGTTSNADVVFTGMNPVVTAVSPSSGSPGDRVTVAGSGFGQQGSLTFNGVTAPVLSWQNNSIVALVPPAAQTGPIVVTQSGIASNNNVTFTVVSAPAPSGVIYGYDALGRLTNVVDASTGSGAVYNYDAVGNILSIQRTSSTSPISITSFDPTSGFASSEVMIVGTNFSSTPSQNTVTFNGTTATVFRATPTTLLVSVPTGATTGSISVTSPAGTATSATAFTVKAGGRPTISTVSPQTVLGGATVTLTGANFDSVAANDHITIGGVPVTTATASPTSLTFTVPYNLGSGAINLQTSAGAASGGDLFIVPQGSGFTASSVAYAARVSSTSATPISFPASNLIALLIFDGAARHNSTWNVTSTTLSGPACTSLWGSAGNEVWGAGQGCQSLVTTVLPTTGTYTFVIAPGWTAGNATAQLFDSVNLGGTIPTDGTSFTITTTTPGQSGTFTFGTPLFSHLFWNETATTFAGCNTNILSPGGLSKSSMSCSTTFSNDLGEVNEGPLTLSIVPTGMNTGSVTMNLLDIPDVSGTITINGASVNLTTTTPKQYGYVTFSGTASQGVTLKISSNITAAGTWFALQHLPDLANVYSSTVYSGSPISQSVTLPSTGNYRVVVAPGGSATGTLTITLTSP